MTATMTVYDRAYKSSILLCKAYKMRNRKDYPLIKDDPTWLALRIYNTELDSLINENRPETVKAFNTAFSLALSGTM